MPAVRPLGRDRLARLAAAALVASLATLPSGCSDTPTPTPVPTATDTATPVPTDTPSVTDTPEPTPTEEPIPLVILHTNDNYGETKECG